MLSYRLIFATHPEVVVDPRTPVPDWGLSAVGQARMSAFAVSEPCLTVARIWASPERKAQEAAEIAAVALALSVETDAGLAEIDREAVGFVAEPRFSALRDRFFAEPERSPDGWERAVDAQKRILEALSRVEAATTDAAGDVLVVSHGAVGALTLAARRGAPISVSLDQPRQGCWFAYRRPDGGGAEAWREMPDA